MTKPQAKFLEELKAKQANGNLKPSDFKKPATTGSNSPANADLTKLQEQLKQAQETIKNLTAQNKALELALFEKRLASLKEFSQYYKRVTELESSEISELATAKKTIAHLRKQLTSKQFTLSLDAHSKWILLTIALVLLLLLLTK